MDRDILSNLREHVFYHGTTLERAESIAEQGFRVWQAHPDYGRYFSGGVLGRGIYITCNWRSALFFGPVLLRVGIHRGTRILNASLRPDRAVIAYLAKEFGRDVLLKPPWRVLPRNKKLKQRELVALFRHHYWITWEKVYPAGLYGLDTWPSKRALHFQCTRDFRSILIRYGFHGYGNPADTNGIVVFSDDRLFAQEMVADVSSLDASAHGIPSGGDRIGHLRSLDEARRCYLSNGSPRAQALEERVRSGLKAKACT